jgi:hypothetical protein
MESCRTSNWSGGLILERQRELLANLEGLIPNDVGLRLASLASLIPSDLAIVEIGSYKGKSTCYLASGSRIGQGARVYAIDPWDLPGNATGRFKFADPTTYSTFVEQVFQAEVEDLVTPIRAFSSSLAKIWRQKIGLLYIDGSHTEKDVQRDWDLWSPFLAEPSVVAFDDYDTERNPGVKRVVDSLVARKNRHWEFGPHPLAIGMSL